MEKRPNLLLITVDALRADHLGCLGYPKNISPHIDQLASQGALFSQAIAHGPRSPASFPSILASVYQSAGVDRGLPQKATTLAEVLKRRGYVTAGFCAGNVYISRYYGYQRGFDLFQDFITLERTTSRIREDKGKLASLRRFVRRILDDTGRYDPAFLLFYSALQGKKNIADMAKSESAYPFEGGETLNEQAMAWLSRPRDEPFFLWLHYMDVHFPYLPRVPRYRPSDYGRFVLSLICLLFKRYAYPRQVLVNLYDARIQDMDRIIARLLDWLRDQGLYEDTLVVLTADHGEEFREHGGWVHAPKLYDELLRVPLIIRGPGIPPGVVSTGQVGLIDLAPSLLNLLGIEEKVQTFQGASFLPWFLDEQAAPSSRYVFSEEIHLGGRRPLLWRQNEGSSVYKICSCRSEEWKYIWDEEGDSKELYHLRLDPEEMNNLANAQPEMTGQLASVMEEHFAKLDSSKRTMPSVAQRDLSQEEEEEIIQRLHDLGYL